MKSEELASKLLNKNCSNAWNSSSVALIFFPRCESEMNAEASSACVFLEQRKCVLWIFEFA